MRFIEYIAIHCSAGFGDVEAIKRFWFKVKKWKQVGYHYFIYESGEIVRLLPISQISNGVQGFNARTVNICYQGGVDRNNVNRAVDTRTPAQKEAILAVIKEVYEELKKYQDVSAVKIRGHRDFSPDQNGNGKIESWERIKECPSFDAIKEYYWIQGKKALQATVLSIVLCLMLLTSGCGTRRKHFESTVKAEIETLKKQHSNYQLNSQTLWYGDSLMATTFLPLGEVQVFEAESGGVKVEGSVTPVIGKDGKQTGSKLNINATAKPIGQTNTNETLTQSQEELGKHSFDGNAKLDDERERPTIAASLTNSIVTLAIAAALGFFLWFKFKRNAR